jgi:Mrp family chromosome partitioning ATPase
MKTKKKSKESTIPLLRDYTSHSRFAEAYRTLRTNIQFSVMDKKFKTLLVTSAGASEGKTSTVANLAFTMAQTGKRVLMLDADMRRPNLSKNLADSDTIGITGLLANFFGTMPDQGNLGEMGVGDLVRLLAFQKKTGLLTLKSGQDELDAFFVNGEMTDIYWRSRPEDKDLVNVLLLENAITPKQAQLVRSRHKDTGQRMEYIVANMGLINEEVLKGTLNIYVIEALRVLSKTQQGGFLFKELSESNLELNIAELVDLPQLKRQAHSGREELPYLEGKIDAAVVEVSDNLFLLASGPLPPNPSEILGSSRMEFLLGYLQNMFDVIIIDSPPILPASDALLISPHTDGVLLVVKAGHLNRDMVQKAVEQLELAQANLLGVVLNDVDINRAGYSGYYQKYYKGYYGEQATKA